MSRSTSKPDFVVKEFPDMRIFMSAGLRYAVGRRTYAPSHMLTYLENHLDDFSNASLEIFKSDLKEYISPRPIGDVLGFGLAHESSQAVDIVRKINERLK